MQTIEFLKISQHNTLLAKDLLTNRDDAQADACIFLFRAWLAIASEVASGSEAIGSAESAVEVLSSSDLLDTQSLDVETLRKDLAIFQKLASDWTEGDLFRPEQLYPHLYDLERIHRILQKKGKPILPKSSIRALAVFSLLLITLIALVFLLLKKINPDSIPTASWREEYYLNGELLGPPALTKRSDRIDYDWSNAPQGFIGASGLFSVRWLGCLNLKEPSLVTFEVGSDDGSRLLLNGNQIIEMWQKQGFTIQKTSHSLPAGTHRLELQYYQDGGAAAVRLRAAFGDQNLEQIPKKLLSPMRSDGHC